MDWAVCWAGLVTDGGGRYSLMDGPDGALAPSQTSQTLSPTPPSRGEAAGDCGSAGMTLVDARFSHSSESSVCQSGLGGANRGWTWVDLVD